MKPPRHVSPSLVQLLESLSGSLPSCDPENSDGMNALVAEFGELERGLTREQTQPLADLARVSQHLVKRLAFDGLVGPRETLEIVAEALAAVRVELGLVEEPEPSARLAPQKSTELSLLDGRRIGELLVTLSMLTPSDVERALAKQRETGMLLGEALVELGIVGRSSVDSALRLQSSRRRRELATDDPWALPGA